MEDTSRVPLTCPSGSGSSGGGDRKDPGGTPVPGLPLAKAKFVRRSMGGNGDQASSAW
jgi:hypothetical protein